VGMKRSLLFSAALFGLTGLLGCSPADRSPDAIRQDTAKATQTAVRDAKAAAQGVVDGVKASGQVNINKAPEERIEKLPGIDAATAHRIVAGRPYEDSSDLFKRHLITKAEYDRIANQVTAK
jgi:DNA uptake protein ComE-like DNA-binding protein